MNNKIVIAVISAILIAVLGFFGYRYLNQTEKLSPTRTQNLPQNESNKEEEMELKSEEVKVDKTANTKTEDKEIDQELNNLEKELDSTLEEVTQ